MILTPAPLQKPASKLLAAPSLRALPVPSRSAALTRPVLQTLRVPQQLCLDLQPRSR